MLRLMNCIETAAAALPLLYLVLLQLLSYYILARPLQLQIKWIKKWEYTRHFLKKMPISLAEYSYIYISIVTFGVINGHF